MQQDDMYAFDAPQTWTDLSTVTCVKNGEEHGSMSTSAAVDPWFQIYHPMHFPAKRDSLSLGGARRESSANSSQSRGVNIRKPGGGGSRASASSLMDMRERLEKYRQGKGNRKIRSILGGGGGGQTGSNCVKKDEQQQVNNEYTERGGKPKQVVSTGSLSKVVEEKPQVGKSSLRPARRTREEVGSSVSNNEQPLLKRPRERVVVRTVMATKSAPKKILSAGIEPPLPLQSSTSSNLLQSDIEALISEHNRSNVKNRVSIKCRNVVTRLL